jgi:hypothetical protein
VKALYSLWCEGYTTDYKRRRGGPDRTTTLKSGVTVRLDGIPDAFKDEFATSAIRFYHRWKILGLPFENWADNPNRLVQVVELLHPLDQLYHPEIRL